MKFRRHFLQIIIVNKSKDLLMKTQMKMKRKYIKNKKKSQMELMMIFNIIQIMLLNCKQWNRHQKDYMILYITVNNYKIIRKT